MDFIPICVPYIVGNEEKYVLDTLRTNWISSQGKYIEAFEGAFASFCGTKHAIATTNGTTAIHLALAAKGIGKGDEVIVPSFTMMASVLPIIYTGATPVFVDCCEDTWCMDPIQLEAKITSRTKAIMPVHIYGHLCDMESIVHIADQKGIAIIEDAAEAHGASQGAKKAGSFGELGCFSLYANKIITTGEGGMVVTDDDDLADRCRSLKNLAFLPDPAKRFEHHEIGFNYRMTNIQAAIGLAQMEYADELVEKRRKNAMLYSERLREIPGVTLPVELKGYKNVYWMYGILLPESIDVPALRTDLREHGVDTRRFFLPMNRQPVLNGMGFGGEGVCPVAENIYRRGILLPSGSGLTEEQIDYVVCAFKKCLKR
jgi:perosamine synthetase